MADVQIHPLGVENVPADAEVPSAAEWLVKGVFAHFDGSAASAAWLPVLEIISDAGTVAYEIPMDSSVAAGASVEATWAPFLRGASAAAAATSGLPWCFAENLFPGTLANNTDTLLTFAAGDTTPSDATIFGTVAGSGGQNTVQLKKAGIYVVYVNAHMQRSGAPAAGAAGAIGLRGSDYALAGADPFLFAAYPGSTTYQVSAFATVLYNLDPGNTTAPVAVNLVAAQSTGGNITSWYYTLLAVLLNPVGSPNF